MGFAVLHAQSLHLLDDQHYLIKDRVQLLVRVLDRILVKLFAGTCLIAVKRLPVDGVTHVLRNEFVRFIVLAEVLDLLELTNAECHQPVQLFPVGIFVRLTDDLGYFLKEHEDADRCEYRHDHPEEACKAAELSRKRECGCFGVLYLRHIVIIVQVYVPIESIVYVKST